ncbi:MAG: flagellar export chaperone FliS [Deltaproteobacteria bacterium]|nr:flagellar export chaperone FliS [Deltaproteobacteria bacterium]
MVHQYKKTEVMTADRVKLIVLLYEGVIKFNNFAKNAIKTKNIQDRNKYINKSMAIISELLNALNKEAGGEIAANLEKLYYYMLEQMIQANSKNDIEPLNIVNKLAAEVKLGWEGIANANASVIQQEMKGQNAGAPSYHAVL